MAGGLGIGRVRVVGRVTVVGQGREVYLATTIMLMAAQCHTTNLYFNAPNTVLSDSSTDLISSYAPHIFT